MLPKGTDQKVKLKIKDVTVSQETRLEEECRQLHVL
jgi:hypothetical protein